MSARKRKTDATADVAEPDETLSAEWQEEFLLRRRLERARIPRRFAAKSFEGFKVGRSRGSTKLREVLTASKRYVASFGEDENVSRACMLRGGTGCGKTHLAVAILKGVIAKDHTGLYCNVPDLLTNIRATYSNDTPESESQLLDELVEPDLLVLDDLGAEATRGWINDRLYLIVNRRYELDRPIVVTTNLDLAELENKLGERTVSRLYEMCDAEVLLEFPHVDYRRTQMH